MQCEYYPDTKVKCKNKATHAVIFEEGQLYNKDGSEDEEGRIAIIVCSICREHIYSRGNLSVEFSIPFKMVMRINRDSYSK